MQQEYCVCVSTKHTNTSPCIKLAFKLASLISMIWVDKLDIRLILAGGPTSKKGDPLSSPEQLSL